MHPTAFQIPLPGWGPLAVSWYGLLTLAGILGCMALSRHELVRAGLLSRRAASDVVLIAAISAFAGGHLTFLLTPGRTAAGWRSGSVLYGAIFGGVLAAVLLARYHRIPVARTLDAAAPAGVLPPLLGRVGCFMAGCCYGTPTDSMLGVTFSDPECVAPTGVPLHPTQLYEAGALLALFAFLQWRRRGTAFPGELLLLYLGLYSAARFLIEFLRGDEIRGFVAGGALSFSQAIALPTLLVTAALYAAGRLRVWSPT